MSNYNLGKKIIITKSAQSTMSFGKKIAKWLIKQNLRDRAFVFALHGDLGSGKTTFVQGLARELGVEDKITSPSFVLIKKFSIFNFQFLNKIKIQNLKFKNFYHIDCYRLQKPEEILELGWQRIITEHKNVVAIEWPERIKKFLPRDAVKINFKFLNQNQREIKIGKTAFL